MEASRAPVAGPEPVPINLNINGTIRPLEVEPRAHASLDGATPLAALFDALVRRAILKAVASR